MKFPTNFLAALPVFFVGLTGFFFAPPAEAAAYDDMLASVKLGDVATVRRYLELGIDVNTSDREGNTVLMLAVREKKPELVRLFISVRAKVNARNINGDSALRLAAYQGNLEMARDLVQAGAQIETEGWTPLIYAAFNGHNEVVAYLIEQGAKVNARSESGMTALMAAARGGFVPIIERLIAAQAKIDARDENRETALDWAEKTKNDKAATLLKQSGANKGKDLPKMTLAQELEQEFEQELREQELREQELLEQESVEAGCDECDEDDGYNKYEEKVSSNENTGEGAN